MKLLAGSPRVTEPIPERIENIGVRRIATRFVALLSDVDRDLVECSGPGVRQLAGKGDVAEKDVGDTDASGTRQPGFDDRACTLHSVETDQKVLGVGLTQTNPVMANVSMGRHGCYHESEGGDGREAICCTKR